MQEKWKGLIYNGESFEELYEISNQGRIRNRKTLHILVLHENASGFFSIILKSKSILIHKAVAENFVPNPNNYPHVKHKNGIVKDNNDTNLEWYNRYAGNTFIRRSDPNLAMLYKQYMLAEEGKIDNEFTYILKEYKKRYHENYFSIVKNELLSEISRRWYENHIQIHNDIGDDTVEYAQWIYVENRFQCSRCKEFSDKKSKYCPHCGRPMN